MYTKECMEENNMGILISVRNPDEKSVPQTAGGKRRSTKFIQNGNFLAQESKRKDDCLTYTFNLLNNLITPYNLKYSKILVMF